MTYVQSKWGMSEPWMTFSWNSAMGEHHEVRCASFG